MFSLFGKRPPSGPQTGRRPHGGLPWPLVRPSGDGQRACPPCTGNCLQGDRCPQRDAEAPAAAAGHPARHPHAG